MLFANRAFNERKPSVRVAIYEAFLNRLSGRNQHMIVWIEWVPSIPSIWGKYETASHLVFQTLTRCRSFTPAQHDNIVPSKAQNFVIQSFNTIKNWFLAIRNQVWRGKLFEDNFFRASAISAIESSINFLSAWRLWIIDLSLALDHDSP